MQADMNLNISVSSLLHFIHEILLLLLYFKLATLKAAGSKCKGNMNIYSAQIIHVNKKWVWNTTE